MFKPGDYCKETNSLIIKEMFWEDIKKKLDEEDFGDQYSWVYSEEKESFEHMRLTHKLWLTMNSEGALKELWEIIE
jgi:hypothetical protein|tara:strand:- start:1060 stop:1287 length:228 start_codon:yes stop_codon:yes gene_type:complete